MPKTAALPGLYFGRVPRAQIRAAVRGIVILQKENGERKDRRQARWKYTLRRLGVEHVDLTMDSLQVARKLEKVEAK